MTDEHPPHQRNDGHKHQWSRVTIESDGRCCELCGWFIPLNPHQRAEQADAIRTAAYFGNL